MQLKGSVSVSKALALATASLLGEMLPVQAEEAWTFDTSLMVYQEEDRVTVIESEINADKELNEDESLSVNATLDALTGASANGAIALPHVQTFTGPSGEGQYSAAAGETPLDPTFRDLRGSLTINWSRQLDRLERFTFGGTLSQEYDYTSVGASARYAREVNQRNTLLEAGLAYGYDQIRPLGGVPIGLSTSDSDRSGGGSEQKGTLDILLGITQVIDKFQLLQFNLSFSSVSGYQSDPYKIVTQVDKGASDLSPVYLHEHRPESREKMSLYSAWKAYLSGDVLTLSWRYYSDSWGIRSHTLDGRYRWQLNSHHYLQPHLRWYRQSESNFYRLYLQPSNQLKFVSADYRLGAFTASTLGVKYGYVPREDHEFGVRAEYYLQSGDNQQQEGELTQLNSVELYPDVAATLLQINYRFLW